MHHSVLCFVYFLPTVIMTWSCKLHCSSE